MDEEITGTPTLSDEDISTEMGTSMQSGTVTRAETPMPGDGTDGTDGTDGDGTDGSDGDAVDGTDGGSSDTDGNDGTDADGTDQ